jgi:hypothetical protein
MGAGNHGHKYHGYDRHEYHGYDNGNEHYGNYHW